MVGLRSKILNYMVRLIHESIPFIKFPLRTSTFEQCSWKKHQSEYREITCGSWQKEELTTYKAFGVGSKISPNELEDKSIRLKSGMQRYRHAEGQYSTKMNFTVMTNSSSSTASSFQEQDKLEDLSLCLNIIPSRRSVKPNEVPPATYIRPGSPTLIPFFRENQLLM